MYVYLLRFEALVYARSVLMQVRAVASPTDNLVLSASRDSTAISWSRESPSSFSPTSILRAGSRYVNAVGYLPPTADVPQGQNYSVKNNRLIEYLTIRN
jgi:hypothetical protein